MSITLSMKSEIQERLHELELKHGIRILYAIESGSRLWGFESINSDYDVRFIYVRPLQWYLSVRNRRNVIELPVSDELDISGWDLRKTLYLLSKSNPPLLEWLNSHIIYKKTETVEKIRNLIAGYFNPRGTIFHYLHMAIGNYKGYILKRDEVILKKYFYILRPLFACEWIEKNQTFPPVQFNKVIDAASADLPRKTVTNLLQRKKQGQELDKGPKIDELNKYIEHKINHFSEVARTAPKAELTMDDLDELFMNTICEEVKQL